MEKEQINTRLPDPLIEEIDERRKVMGKTRGAYLALIAEHWFAVGCPDVNEFETKLRERPGAKRAS